MTAAAIALIATLALPAIAPGGGNTDGPTVTGGTTSGGLSATLINNVNGDSEDRSDNSSPDRPATGPSFQIGESACAGASVVADPDINGPAEVTLCAESHTTTIRTIDLGMIQRAFAELKLPASTLVIQPPDGLTLVNFDTNFYTTSTRPISRTVTLLGQRVTLEATPSTFHWTFGDGERLSTSKPGAPYPDLTVTHNYLRKGTYRPSLATTFTGRYRLGGGPWRTIPGTVTIDGTGQPLRAIEAQPKLVSY